MKTRQVKDTPTPPGDPTIVEEAADWLIRLEDTAPSPDDPYHDPSVRHRAFFDWVKRSPAHLCAFMEIMELERRIRRLDSDAFSGIQSLIEAPRADVATFPPQWSHAPETQLAARAKARSFRTGTAAGLIAAGCITVAAFLYLFPSRPEVYITHIGEQHQYELQDGSMIQLNTDTRVDVDFSKDARDVRLIRGEAFFIVKHDARRPFTVATNGATVRALGTEFDVRQRQQSTGVTVLTGSVQLATAPPGGVTPVSKRVEATHAMVVLTAGEMAEISSAGVTKVAPLNLNDTLSWRQNRLVFHNARLIDVVDEFNRYNLIQIRVEGATAQEMKLSGIFDQGGYQDILLFARKMGTLSVERDGNDWVIRARN